MDMQDLKSIVSALVTNQRRHEEFSGARDFKFNHDSDSEFGSINTGMRSGSIKTDYTRFGFDRDLLASEVYRRLQHIKRMTRMEVMSENRDGEPVEMIQLQRQY